MARVGGLELSFVKRICIAECGTVVPARSSAHKRDVLSRAWKDQEKYNATLIKLVRTGRVMTNSCKP